MYCILYACCLKKCFTEIRNSVSLVLMITRRTKKGCLTINNRNMTCFLLWLESCVSKDKKSNVRFGDQPLWYRKLSEYHSPRKEISFRTSIFTELCIIKSCFLQLGTILHRRPHNSYSMEYWYFTITINKWLKNHLQIFARHNR